METQLTFRQERFVFEYLKDQNASAAAARAGYTARSMAAQGSELMSNPAVRDRVRLEMQGMLSEVRCSAVELMKQRMRVAFFDAGKLVRGWEPIPLEELDEETRRAVEVSTIMRKSGPEVRVRQPDRNKALRALEKVLEGLERLNAQCYAQLERAGEIPSLEELERMAEEDDALAVAAKPAGDISKEPLVLSGSVEMAETREARFVEKCPERNSLGGPMVLSGLAPGVAEARRAAFSEKHPVLSGSAATAATSVPRYHENPQPFPGWEMGAATRLLSRKPQVLSGAAAPR